MNTKMRLALVWGLLFIPIASVAVVAATGGSMRGYVADSSEAPLTKVTITIEGVDFTFEKVTSTSKKGSFNLTVPDAGRDYVIRLEKPGYVTLKQPLKLTPGQVLNKEWTLYTVDESAQQGAQLEVLKSKDKATKAYNRGAEAYNANDLEAAIAAFREAVDVNPDFELAYAALGRVLLQEERWGEARVAAEAVLELNPGQSLGLQMLFDSYWGEGDTDKAEEVLKRLREVDAGSAVAVRVFNQAVAATKEYDYDTAAKGFAEALELDSNLHQAILPLAQIYHSKGEWQAAIDKAEEYLEHEPGNARANVVRYFSYLELGNQESADQAFSELEQHNPTAAAEMFLADSINAFNAGSIAEAAKAVETSISFDPTNPKAHHQLGLCYASLGENSKARAAFEKFLELAPEHPEAASAREMLTYLK